MIIDPVALTKALIRLPSVTPNSNEALLLLRGLLSEHGFNTAMIEREGIPNLFARFGQKNAPRRFGFNGHVDVVPVGNLEDWSVDPFGAEQSEGWLYGRGATDMKSGVAAFVAASVEFASKAPEDAAIILAITGDEEGSAQHGTLALMDWMQQHGESMHACLVGEPTCPEHLGDMIKIGRRGSISAFITMVGKQGHAAYPKLAINPLEPLAMLATNLMSAELDQGTEHFDPSSLVITSLDTGNDATNVIPERAKMTLNIRFNNLHSGESLKNWLENQAEITAKKYGAEVNCVFQISGESFLTKPGKLSSIISKAVERQTGRSPKLSTSGGTSDARFIKDHCPVVEFGLVGHRMHAVDECVWEADIPALSRIYLEAMEMYFSA